ncbi:MAG: hypothetical protein ACI8TP_004454 [Acidimicrobiales bacterium]|jgi:hypothetical protein
MSRLSCETADVQVRLVERVKSGEILALSRNGVSLIRSTEGL